MERKLTSTAAAASASAAALGLGLVDAEGPAVHLVPVQLLARVLGRRRRHRDEAEAPDATGVPVQGHEAVLDLPVLLEEALDAVLRRVERQVSDVELDVLLARGVEAAGPSRTEGTGSAAAAAAGRGGTLGAALVDPDRPAVELALVHLRDRLLGAVARFHRDETEPAGTLRPPLDGQENLGDRPELAELVAEALLVGGCCFVVSNLRLFCCCCFAWR